jgi:hypothetical protein
MSRFHKFSDPNLLLECNDSGNPVAIRNKDGARSSIVSQYSSVSDLPPASQFGVGVAQVGNDLIVSNDSILSKFTARSSLTADRIAIDWKNGTFPADAGGASFAIDATEKYNGSAVAKCTFANSTTYNMAFSLTNYISLKDITRLSIPIKITCGESASGVGQSSGWFYLWLGTTGGKNIRLGVRFDSLPPGEWQTITWSNVDNGSVDGIVNSGSTATWSTLATEAINSITIVQVTGANSASYPVWLGPVIADSGYVQDKGLVSFVFDGCFDNQYTNLFPLLKEFGAPACLALTSGYIGTVGRATENQLDEMYQSGLIDMIHHTFANGKLNGYSNVTDWPTSFEICNDILAQWAYFKTKDWSRGIGYAVEAFGGNFTASITQTVQKKIKAAFKSAGVKCMRRSVSDYSRLNAVGYKPVEDNLQSVISSLSLVSTTTLGNVTALIDKAVSTKQHLVIHGHEVVSSGPTGNQITVDLMRQILQYTINHADLEIVKFTDVAKLYY